MNDVYPKETTEYLVMNHKEFRRWLRHQVKFHGSQKNLARICGVSPQYLNNVMRGIRHPGPKICKGLGVMIVENYVVGKPNE